MQYDAITLDTNVFDQQGLNLEGGLLKLLLQFKEGMPQFILSEIVLRELHRHLAEQAKKAKDALGSAIRKGAESGLLDPASATSLNAVHRASADPRKAAQQRLEYFLNNSGCEIISADQADMKRLIRMYFGPMAPFEEGEKKKNEFPDAIALITLEEWAKRNGKVVLAISWDGGWARFAENSEWTDVEAGIGARAGEISGSCRACSQNRRRATSRHAERHSHRSMGTRRRRDSSTGGRPQPGGRREFRIPVRRGRDRA
jgi:hypothetical protein